MKKMIAALATGLLIATIPAAILAKPALRKRVPAPTAQAGPHWDQTITLSEQGFPIMGSPNAPVKVVEFISFTCPHCADFSQESKVPLQMGLVRQGKVSLELRPFIRVSLDAIPSLLAMCGDKSKFFPNEAALFAAQKTWFHAPADPGYQARWQALENDLAAQRKVAARDLGLFKIMQARGYTAAQLDACLVDQKKLDWLIQQTDYAGTTIGVTGTPSFTINGVLQTVYAWEPLKPLLESAQASSGPAPLAVPDIPASRATPTYR
ncbi:MAG: DsbA family protein [Novosphingobium sp.]